MLKLRADDGAVAVELALVLPVLLLLLLGIVEFGRVFQTQSTLTAAAREGVRVMAIEDDHAAARAAVQATAGSLDPAVADTEITVTPGSCAGSTGNAVVTITYRQPFLTSFFGEGIDMDAQGVMRCSG